jgi:hypothetical protein
VPSHRIANLAYEPTHPDALAVYCSDGRFTEAIEALVKHNGHPRLDTLTIPGGPGLLELTSSSYATLETLRNAASFLIVGHHIKTVTLVAHDGCGYYKDRYRLESEEAMKRRQIADLRGAAKWVRATHQGVAVTCYFARPQEGHVTFDDVEIN